MHSRLILFMAAALVTLVGSAQADDGLDALGSINQQWAAAYNAGDGAKLAGLYAKDGVFNSGVYGSLRGTEQIEKAVTDSMKKWPKIAVTPKEAHIHGDVLWGVTDFSFDNGPSGHAGFTALKSGNAWQIVQHVSNVTPPPAK